MWQLDLCMHVDNCKFGLNTLARVWSIVLVWSCREKSFMSIRWRFNLAFRFFWKKYDQSYQFEWVMLDTPENETTFYLDRVSYCLGTSSPSICRVLGDWFERAWTLCFLFFSITPSFMSKINFLCAFFCFLNPRKELKKNCWNREVRKDNKFTTSWWWMVTSLALIFVLVAKPYSEH